MFKVNKYFIIYVFLLVVIGYKGRFFLAFTIALFHEGVHYFTAKKLGFNGLQIEFFPLGTALKMNDLEEASPYEDLLISISGPLSNILIGIVFMILDYKFPMDIFTMLFYGNLSIGLFNLIPALPLDGGRIIRNLLNFKTFYKRANKITVNISIILGIGMIFSYLVLFIKGENSFSIGLAALFIIVTSLKEKERVAYIIMGDVIKKRYKFLKRGYIENRSISIYCKMDLINLMNFIDKNKYNIFMIMDENMKLLDILYEEDIIEALKIYGNIKIDEYLKQDYNGEKRK
ncbi:MAG: metalloprotease [Clostridiaceae bacterium]|nr:metalloprotease [Clostridiaceae bacterium]